MLGLLAVCVVSPAAAQADAAQAKSKALEEVVVTASRRPESLATTLASVSVVTRADIETRQYATFDRLLNDLPGMAIGNNGGLGKSTSLFIRGAESDHNLVLINGLRWGSATLGLAALQDIPLELIERVEIVRGPRSSLYGADALGGVVQIFTRRAPEGTGLRTELVAGYGSNSTQRASVGFGGGTTRGDWQFGVSWLKSDGTNACRGFGAPIFAGCFTNEPDDDGYRNAALSLRGGFEVGAAARVDLFASGTDGRVEFDGSFSNNAEFRQLALGVALTASVGVNGRFTVQLGRSTDDTENFANRTFSSRFETTRDSASFQWDASLTDAFGFVAGVDYGRDRVDSTTVFAERSRRTVGVYGQGEMRAGAHVIQLGARYDDNEQFGSETTGSVGWGWSFAPNWRLTAAASTGFKAPTFNELYFPGFGNPNLKPETSESLELGVRWSRDSGWLALTIYQNRIDDLIGFGANFIPVNVDEARIRGLELTGQFTLANWQLRGSAEWLDPENRSPGANLGRQLPRRPKEALRADIARRVGAWTFGARALYQGERFDNLSNTRRMSSFVTVDGRIEWQATDSLRLQARVDNAFDREYETALFFPQPGREWHVTVRYQPRSR
ncbi:MAG: TonB-dependent receptor [Steroidobacteraceae bacterium]|nr:TonB-dependent receptor [Steroidobacteraceae bacterium]